MRVTKLMIKPLALAVAITSLGVMNAQAAPKDPDKSTMAYEGTPSAVDAESAKKVFGKNQTFLRLVQYLSKRANFEIFSLGPKFKLFASRFHNTP